uniref:Uncharacterized protein n=1 Tax=Oryza punctata TaxID=4537 RepID=A0A0E0L199_ORYPU
MATGLNEAEAVTTQMQGKSSRRWRREGRGGWGGGDKIYIKKPAAAVMMRDETSVAMPILFMMGSVVGKRFYRKATVGPHHFYYYVCYN